MFCKSVCNVQRALTKSAACHLYKNNFLRLIATTSAHYHHYYDRNFLHCTSKVGVSNLSSSRSIHRNHFRSGLTATLDDDDGEPSKEILKNNYKSSNSQPQWIEALDVVDEKKGSFDNFQQLSKETIAKLQSMGIKYFFPVQSNTFDAIYEEYDVIVQARTGSGKTMSYAVPLVEKLLKQSDSNANNRRRLPKMLVLTPTRELANQVSSVVSSLTSRLNVAAVYGGAAIVTQENQLRRGADIVVGTPGRILDLISRRSLDLAQLNHVVLDEVDRMLDMGFADDVDDILKNRYRKDDRENNPQTLLFSATVPTWVQQTARKYLSRDIKMIDLIGRNANKTAVTVKHTAMLCSTSDRVSAITDILTKHGRHHYNNNSSSTTNVDNNKTDDSIVDSDRVNDDNNNISGDDDSNVDVDDSTPRILVFCQTKREVDEIGACKQLRGRVATLHGDISQVQREISLKKFKNGKVDCLVATDVAARGLDIPDVDVVIQCSPPQDVESYIHRSGRTGRAGKSGECIMLYTPEEVEDVLKVEKIAGFTFNKMNFQRSMQTMKLDVLRMINNVSSSTNKKFAGIASELTKEVGMDRLLSSAIAVMCGFEQKSLITLQPGLLTLQVASDKSRISTKTQAWSHLNNILSESTTRDIRNLRLCSDYKSFVFDIPSRHEEKMMREFETIINSNSYRLTTPEHLPSIVQSDITNVTRSSSFSPFNRHRSGFNRSRWTNEREDDDEDDDNDDDNHGKFSRLSHSYDNKYNRYKRDGDYRGGRGGFASYGRFGNKWLGDNRGGRENGDFKLKHRRSLSDQDD
ncbi:hypothetical protein HELRODRAFT_110575 [Helobdella robusta]|uniref:Uncharacterized protein n=1 Tax=Helobdella robusta TaxID=6412 RepID=T1EF33_HELRO|nr:hypothetical protein HELRODRAFT_110575 [Helobdella robusta]ESO07746.1 hypothetical protein HELRODRAFT_110575 [Helobdella robusta]